MRRARGLLQPSSASRWARPLPGLPLAVALLPSAGGAAPRLQHAWRSVATARAVASFASGSRLVTPRQIIASSLSCAPAAPTPRRGVFSAAVQARLQAVADRHAELSTTLASPDVDQRVFAKLSRELNQLEKVVVVIREYREALAEAADLTALSDGGGEDELAKMAATELAELQPAIAALEDRLIKLMIPRDEADSRDAILEIRAGTGGDEAALFGADLMRMYQQYCEAKGWSWSPLSVSLTDHDGVKEASIAVSGDGAFGRLKFESGVHRVQRVPATEGAGRVHTSTATVAVLAEAEEVDVDIKTADLRIDTYRAQGAGGQHVNTTDSAVRITHLPTGTVVTCQDERSQQQNRVKALRVLRARLFEQERERLEKERAEARRSQIGRGDRSERVRTYNFSQNRVTDHRVNISKFDMDSVMRGEALDEFIDALEAADTAEALKHFQL